MVLDSSGRAVVFLTGSYKFRLEDSLGNLIRETDNVTAFSVQSSTVDDIIANFTEDVITAADSVIFADASDSNSTKRDTVQGILDLVPTITIPFPIRTRAIINQTGTQSIVSSTNVASITDLGTGLTRITFTTAYPDANYNVQCSAVQKDGAYYLHAGVYYTGGSLSKTTTYVDIQSFYGASGAIDSEYLDVVIFGELA